MTGYDVSRSAIRLYFLGCFQVFRLLMQRDCVVLI
jgi:hypothetical protein